MAETRRFDRNSFKEWAGHPLTALYRQFLRDQREALKEQWASGLEMDLRSQTKALLMGELSDLEWGDVARFYEIESEEDGTSA